MISIRVQLVGIFTVTVSWLYITHGLHPLHDELMTTDDLHQYFGEIVSEDASSFDVVDIWDVTNDISKRSSGSDSQDHHDVKFHAFGENYHARLYENRFLMPPNLHVERWGKEGMRSSSPVKQGCYFMGELLSHNRSVVAISQCSGLKGLISHGESDLHILPLSTTHTDLYRKRFKRDTPNLHIIHKRRSSAAGVSDPYSQFCSTDNTKDLVDPKTGLTKEDQLQAIIQDQPYQYNVDQKFMELLIVADNMMRLQHGEEVETYVMTIMNIVARRFIDPTLEQNIRIHVVKFIVLESDQVGTSTDSFPQEGSFTVSSDGVKLLSDFCKWQDVINPMEDTTSDHWDNAIFISRYDLYDPEAGNDFLLGRAYTGGTCSRSIQCSVNEDDGLGTGLTTAHETGHNLNLDHDSGYGCPDRVNIMSGIRSAAGIGSFEWSECSRINIQTFLNSPISSCLNDDPLTEPVAVDILPGTTIGYDSQCILAFGKGYSSVPNEPVDCSVLACIDSRGRISSKGVPVMEGTPCADRKWCLSARCVENEGLPDPIDGGWSPWEDQFGSCSRSCGRGVQERRRFCTNPTPLYGGRGCLGDAVEYRVCNFQSCDVSQDAFRAEQCTSTNNEPFDGQLYTWEPYIYQQSGDGLCDHKCVVVGLFWVKRSPFQFTDGTQCWDDEIADATRIKSCVAGTCRDFGCDGIENSNLVYDQCGICDGNGNTCEQIEDVFTGGDRPGYVTFLTLPIGTTQVRITNDNVRFTYITAKSDGVRFLSGSGSYVPSNGRYNTGNAILHYERSELQESIILTGPTNKVVEVEVYLIYDPTLTYVGDVNVRPMVRYQYFTPISDSPVASWTTSAFSECSATCGSGIQTRSVTCTIDVDGNAQTVEDARCPDMPTPPMASQSCNDFLCPDSQPVEWQASEWFPCSATCANGTQNRIVTCVIITNPMTAENNIAGNIVADEKCEDIMAMPSLQRSCNDGSCPDQVPGNCDGLSTSETGMITRIGPTPDGNTCRQMIVAPPGKDISITFTLINLDCEPGESFSFRVGIFGSTYSYCGYYPDPSRVSVKDNIVWIEHKSAKEGHGYDAFYSFVDSSEAAPDCYQVYTESAGVIQSVNYPENYPPDQRCSTVIVVPPGNKIRLSFRGFRIEDGTVDGQCPNDSLEVVDYNPSEDEQSNALRYCGKLERFNWRSRRNVVLLNFLSNARREYKGYLIKYKTI